MENKKEKLSLASDYMRGAHPNIIKRLVETNMEKTPGYGRDLICEEARRKIRIACNCSTAVVEFLVGGTQTNAVMIDAFLRSYEGVIAAETGHISVHEAGAIEAGGHKVLTIPHELGKISAHSVREYLRNYYNDANREHMVVPGMVYISHPTEYGTLYTKAELKELRSVCDEYSIPLYLDGARLAYALACPKNELTLEYLAMYCDAFYIGGTKCGALFGEAVVIPDPERIPRIFTIIKQHGALLAKGRLLGIQFDELFSNDLYANIGKKAIEMADKIREALQKKGHRLLFSSPTNQIFLIMENGALEEFSRSVDYGFWEKYDDNHTVIRLATDWSTTEEDMNDLFKVLGI